MGGPLHPVLPKPKLAAPPQRPAPTKLRTSVTGEQTGVMKPLPTLEMPREP